jgi:predicted dehydrogenase
VALVSGHPDKARALADKYGIDQKNIFNYDNYDKIKDNPEIDVIYVVLPNSMHAEYTIRAANAGKHVMCEKPMAINVDECQQMIDACKKNNRKLQIGYRLHYEPNNLKAMEIARGGQYGKLRQIVADHGFNVGPHEWRTDKKLAGGGPLMDVGIYCVQAARYLSGEEPTHVTAQTWKPEDDERFKTTEASMAFTLKFPGGALATCSCSYAAHGISEYHFMTEQAYARLDQAFAYGGMSFLLKDRGKPTMLDLPQINQFAAEMDAFADCVLNDKPSQTPGEEGLADIKVMMKLYEAAESGKTVAV